MKNNRKLNNRPFLVSLQADAMIATTPSPIATVTATATATTCAGSLGSMSDSCVLVSAAAEFTPDLLGWMGDSRAHNKS
jgi:hypothetical protein